MTGRAAAAISKPLHGSVRKGIRDRAALDVLRFLAAAFILLYHALTRAPVKITIEYPFLSQGWIATDFFLVLSGFVLSRAYAKKLVAGDILYKQFIVQRFLRIYPSYIIVLIGFAFIILGLIVLGRAPSLKDYSVGAFISQALLLHAFVRPDFSWNVPTWTLSALFICYAILPVYARFYIYRSTWLLVIGAMLILVSALVLSELVLSASFVDLHFHYRLLRVVPLFVIGTLVERISSRYELSAPQYAVSLVGAVGLVLVAQAFNRTVWTDGVTLFATIAMVANSGSATIRTTSLSKKLGDVSYSLFLTHTLVLAVWSGVAAKISGISAWGLWAAGLALAVATAFVFDAAIDRPVSRLVMDKWKKRSIEFPPTA